MFGRSGLCGRVTTVGVTVALGALASAAGAHGATVADDTADQFAQGTTSGAVVRTLTGGDGAVELSRTLEQSFDAAALPAGWVTTPWAAGGVATVAGGALLVDGARVDSAVSAGPGSSLQLRATLGSQPFAHAGYATDFDLQPWAMFSTGPDGGGKVYARTSDGAGGLANVDAELPGVSATVPHDYRVDWTTTGFSYYVDGALVATHALPVSSPMRAQASDLNPDGARVSIDAMSLNAHPPTGTFVSRVLDAGDPRATALSLAPTAETPAGTAVAYETRTASALADLATAPWTSLGAGGAVASPPARYVQYRATLSTSVTAATPRLDRVEVGFTIEPGGPPPSTVDDGSGAAPVVPDQPAGPPAGSGTGAPLGTTPSGPAADVSAPAVRITQRWIRVSRRGEGRLRVTCPRAEARCIVTVSIVRGGRTVATTTRTVSRGATRALVLRLSRATRAKLAARSRLTATAVVTARDAAGNHRRTKLAMTLLPAVR